MPTNPNMVAIQTVTVGSGGAASIEFASIPQTYTDLVLHFSGRGTQTAGVVADIDLQFNSSTANFSRRTLRGSGSAASSTSASDNYGAAVTGNSATASTFGSWQIYIPNYTSSNNKSFSIDTVTENNATEAWQYMLAGLWSNSAAISNIKVVPQTGTWMQYSTATLYGVTSAAYGAKATGGIITSDADYYYHTFLASGTFTPTQSLTADCLVIAGGGGGGGEYYGGGGGAGGLLAYTSQSLTAQNYTITVGAGGAGGATGANKGGNGNNSQFGSLTASTGGGGGGNYQSVAGNNGGSGGGGGGGNSSTGGTGTSGQGSAGGTGAPTQANTGAGAGGGGATAVGGNGSTSQGGTGGAGSSSYSSWGSATGIGQNSSGTYYYAGGGGGGSGTGNNPVNTRGAGGLGGGGNGDGWNNGPTLVAGSAGTAYTGGGGGGGSAGSAGYAGGSGVIIVRYAK
jgi:hypothetical protein